MPARLHRFTGWFGSSVLANHLLGTFLCDTAHVIVKCSHPKYSGQDNVVLDQNVPAVQCQHDTLSEAFLL